MNRQSTPYARRYWKLADEAERVRRDLNVRIDRVEALMTIERDAYAASEGLDPDTTFTVEVPAPARSGRPKAVTSGEDSTGV